MLLFPFFLFRIYLFFDLLRFVHFLDTFLKYLVLLDDKLFILTYHEIFDILIVIIDFFLQLTYQFCLVILYFILFLDVLHDQVILILDHLLLLLQLGTNQLGKAMQIILVLFLNHLYHFHKFVVFRFNLIYLQKIVVGFCIV
jgi:hypothetical protein